MINKTCEEQKRSKRNKYYSWGKRESEQVIAKELSLIKGEVKKIRAEEAENCANRVYRKQMCLFYSITSSRPRSL